MSNAQAPPHTRDNAEPLSSRGSKGQLTVGRVAVVVDLGHGHRRKADEAAHGLRDVVRCQHLRPWRAAGQVQLLERPEPIT